MGWNILFWCISSLSNEYLIILFRRPQHYHIRAVLRAVVVLCAGNNTQRGAQRSERMRRAAMRSCVLLPCVSTTHHQLDKSRLAEICRCYSYTYMCNRMASDAASLLLRAAEQGDNDTLAELLNQSISPNVQNASHFTPLILAAFAGSIYLINAHQYPL